MRAMENNTTTVTMPLSEYQKLKSDAESFKSMHDFQFAQTNSTIEMKAKELNDDFVRKYEDEKAEMIKDSERLKRNAELLKARCEALWFVITELKSRTFFERLFNINKDGNK